MKKFSNMMNWFLLFSFPILLLTVNIKTNTINSNINPKSLATNLVTKVEERKIAEKEEIKTEEEKTEINNDKKELVTEKENIKNNIDEVSILQKEEKPEDKKIEPVVKTTDILTSYNGTMSFYQAKCTGCSGVTSTGVDVSDGKLYYYDKTYGNVRIVAAGLEIKKWSVIRIKNSSLGSSVLAIVLDRGGAIGLGKTFLIDMLTNTSENKGGIEKNITVEVVRDGA